MLEVIKTREWDLVKFDRSRIEIVIEKAAISAWITALDFIEDITDKIIEDLKKKVIKSESKEFITVEMIQDKVENELMESGHFEVVKSFILYRNERQRQRERKKELVEKKLENQTFKITKSNWKKETFDMEKVRKTYKIVSYALARKCKFDDISESLKKYLVEWMKTSDITQMMIKSAVDLISVENTSWQFIAGRLALIDLYKAASKNRNMDIKKIYEAKHYKELFDEYVEKWLYYKKFYDYYTEDEILEAWKYLQKQYDFDYNYTTILMYKKRYLLNPNKIVKELPQEMYMSVALFLAIPEPKEKRFEVAKKIYEYCATWKISLPTPTLLNARTNFHQLSSCFKKCEYVEMENG